MLLAARVCRALVLLTGVSACSSGDGDEEENGTGTTLKIEPAAQERADAALLQLSDFPDGWRGSAADPDDDRGEDFRKCIGVDYSGLTRTGEADSQAFAKDQAQASSSSTVFADADQAESWMAKLTEAMNGSAAEDCFQELIEKAVRGESGFKLGEVDLGQLSFTPPAGVDEAFAWQVKVPVEITSGAVKGMTPDIYTEVVYLRSGDMAATVQTEDVLSAFDPELRADLVAAVAGRMTAPAT